MEAATPLHPTNVRVVGDRVLVDGLVVDDEAAVRLVHAREEAGDHPAKVISDAIEIGARVLDREQTGANAEFVKTEFERAGRELTAEMEQRARGLSEQLDRQMSEVFGPDNGHLAKSLERHFGDGSSSAVQNRVRDVVSEVMTKSREDLTRQFSADDGRNPLAGFQKASLAIIKQASDQQDANLRALLERLAGLQGEVARLHADREKQLELSEVEDRGTAKGRTFEEAVHEALDQIAAGQGDDCDAVGDVKGSGGRVGDIVVDIDACAGPGRGRIVFEAKNSKLSKPEAMRQLDTARIDRDADFAILVVPSEEKIPARMLPLREHHGDKMIVTYDPEEGSTLALQLAYSLARARVLMTRGGGDGIDAAAVADTVERAIGALGEARKIKSTLTGVTTSIEGARTLLESMERAVRDQLEHIVELTTVAADEGES